MTSSGVSEILVTVAVSRDYTIDKYVINTAETQGTQ